MAGIRDFLDEEESKKIMKLLMKEMLQVTIDENKISARLSNSKNVVIEYEYVRIVYSAAKGVISKSWIATDPESGLAKNLKRNNTTFITQCSGKIKMIEQALFEECIKYGNDVFVEKVDVRINKQFYLTIHMKPSYRNHCHINEIKIQTRDLLKEYSARKSQLLQLKFGEKEKPDPDIEESEDDEILKQVFRKYCPAEFEIHEFTKDFAKQLPETIGDTYQKHLEERKKICNNENFTEKLQTVFFTSHEREIISCQNHWIKGDIQRAVLKAGVLHLILPDCQIMYNTKTGEVLYYDDEKLEKALNKAEIVICNSKTYMQILDLESTLTDIKEITGVKYTNGFLTKSKYPKNLKVEISVKVNQRKANVYSVSLEQQDPDHPTVTEVKTAYKQAIDEIKKDVKQAKADDKKKEEKKKQEEMESLIKSGLLGSHLVRGILDTVKQNKNYITKGMIETSLKGQRNRSNANIKDSGEYGGKFFMVDADTIESALDRMTKVGILKTQEIKGTYGSFFVYRPTDSAYIDVLVNVKCIRKPELSMKTTKYDELNDDELDVFFMKTEKDLKPEDWKKLLLVLENAEYCSYRQEMIVTYFQKMPDIVKKYLEIKTTLEGDRSKYKTKMIKRILEKQEEILPPDDTIPDSKKTETVDSAKDVTGLYLDFVNDPFLRKYIASRTPAK